jgi:glycosyltransferase involved in cell wall biosynthesis
VDTVLVHSYPIIDAIKSNNLPTEKVTYIPHWDFPSFMDDAPVQPSKRIAAITDSNAEIKFLFIGQINHNKGLSVLLKAIDIVVNKQFKNFKVFIFGKSKKTFSTAVLHEYIKEHNLEDYVLFMDEFVPEDEMTPIISACDVLLIPYTYIYNSGSILRFLAYRKPILHSDLPSFQELLSGYEVGRSFINNDENDFSEAIISLLSDKDLDKYKDQINLWFERKYDFNEHVGYLKAIMA